MTATDQPARATTEPSSYEPRRAFRDTREPVVGGVAGGLAIHLAGPVLWAWSRPAAAVGGRAASGG